MIQPVPSSFAKLKEHGRTFWRARNARERRVLIAGSGLLLLVFIYALLIEPAVRHRAELKMRLPELRQQAATMQGMASIAKTLSTRPSASVPAMTSQSIQTILVQHGLTVKNLSVGGNFASLQLTGVSFADLMRSLDQMQRVIRVSVIEANVIALPTPGLVNANFSLRQQGVE